MQTDGDITIEIAIADRETILAVVSTPAGVVELLGTVSPAGRVLFIDRAHIGVLGSGTLGRAGLNAIAQRIMEEADVDALVVAGRARSTGPLAGRTPRAVRFARTSPSREGGRDA